MDLDIPNIKIDRIVNIIKDLGDEYSKQKDLILSEGDLECHLFRKLYLEYASVIIEEIDSPVSKCIVHANISFYDNNEKLRLIPDITILNSSHLSIFQSIQKYGTPSNPDDILPAKGFEFAGDAVIFELKFCKDKDGIKNSDIKKYKKDITKIKKIQDINDNLTYRNRVFGFFIVFNKTDIISSAFEDFLISEKNNDRLKIIYVSGKVDFNKENTEMNRI